MRFRKVAIAALILLLAAVGGLAAYSISDQARAEAAQQPIDRSDSLAVEPDIRQKLVSDKDHDPTRYGDNSTLTVTYNGTVWNESEDYEYYQASGEIEFLRDENESADIDYRYYVPEDQVADARLKSLTRATGDAVLIGVGLSFVVLFLFIGGFVAKRMSVNSNRGRGR